MAGRPIAKARRERVLNWIKDRSAPRETQLDWVEAQVASGRTMRVLTSAISHDLGEQIGQGVIERALVLKYGEAPVAERLAAARKVASHVLAEQALELVDNVEPDRDAIAKVKEQVAQRNWTAARWNREQYGDKSAPEVNVNVNNLTLGQDHLAALRRRTVTARVVEEPAQLAPPEDEPEPSE